MRRLCGMCLVAALITSSGCAWMAERRFISQVRNKPAANFELTALDGGKVRLSDFRGKPVLLAFWAYG